MKENYYENLQDIDRFESFGDRGKINILRKSILLIMDKLTKDEGVTYYKNLTQEELNTTNKIAISTYKAKLREGVKKIKVISFRDENGIGNQYFSVGDVLDIIDEN